MGQRATRVKAASSSLFLTGHLHVLVHHLIAAHAVAIAVGDDFLALLGIIDVGVDSGVGRTREQPRQRVVLRMPVRTLALRHWAAPGRPADHLPPPDHRDVQGRQVAGHSVDRQRLARQPDELQALERFEPNEVTAMRFQWDLPPRGARPIAGTPLSGNCQPCNSRVPSSRKYSTAGLYGTFACQGVCGPYVESHEMDKFTLKAQEAMQEGQTLARRGGQSQLRARAPGEGAARPGGRRRRAHPAEDRRRPELVRPRARRGARAAAPRSRAARAARRSASACCRRSTRPRTRPRRSRTSTSPASTCCSRSPRTRAPSARR